MNAIIQRWVKTLRAELLDRTLVRPTSDTRFTSTSGDNQHRTHRALAAASPLRELPHPLGADRIERLTIGRHDTLGGVIHEYRNAA